ncbi:hypothetical protein ACQP0C_37115 [Nocardia sp. CA-129566]|uniref:WXG100-like domain-containing protein n=1 Tax=Nocardia sp. CA-129566 TaxID=3239976 RepID=UPI003D97D3A8
MFIDITPLWSWIPGWILSALNFGMTYPNGQVTPMHDLSEVWKWAAGEMRKLEDELKAATDAALKHYEGGEGSAEMKKEFDKQFTGDNSVSNVAAGLRNLGDYTHDGMKGLYQDQMWSALFAGMTAYSAIALIVELWPFGLGAASVELAISREALALAEREAAELAAEEAGKAGLRNLLKPYLKEIGLQLDKWAGDSLARKAAVGGVRLAGAGAKAGLHGAMADLGIQVISDPGGPIDWGQVGTSALTWGAGGMAGRAAGLGVSKGLGKAMQSDLGQRMAASANPVARAAVSPRTMGLATGLVSGAAGAVGMYGAMAAVDPNAKFSPQMLAAGFGMGALGGARMGQAEASGVGTTSHAADGHTAKPAMVTPETSAEGKKLYRQVVQTAHPDRYPPGAQRDAAEAITKDATNIKGQAKVGELHDQYSDKHVDELRKLHQQSVELASSTTTNSHGGGAGAPPVENVTRTAGSGAQSTGPGSQTTAESAARPADSGARVAGSGDGSARPPSTPERPAGQGQSARGGVQRAATESFEKSRAGIAASENASAEPNLAAGQQDKPAPSNQINSEAQHGVESGARVPEQRAPEASDDGARARPAEHSGGESEPRVSDQRRPNVPVDDSPARLAPEQSAPDARAAEQGAPDMRGAAAPDVRGADQDAPEARATDQDAPAVSQRRCADAALDDPPPRPPDDPSPRQVDPQPGRVDSESAVVPAESDGSHAYVDDRSATSEPARAHPTPVGEDSFRVPEQRTPPEPQAVNSCVPEAFRQLEQAQGRPVANGPAPQQRSLAGVPLYEIQRAIPRGEFEGFAPDRSSSGHAQIVDATVRAGKGASALVAEERAVVNAGGAQGHVYTLTYKGDNHFDVNGKSAVHVETDVQGREWFVLADENGRPLPGHEPQSLAELAGGATRADAVAAEAVIFRAGEVISGLGNPNAPRLSGELMMGATPEPRAEVRTLHAEYRHAATEEARARAESTRLREQAQQAREAGLHDRARELDERVRRLDVRVDAAGTQAELLRARVVESEQAKLTEQQEAVRTQTRELEGQLTDAVGDQEQVRQFSTDLALIDRIEAATQERGRVDNAQQELRNQLEPIREQLETGRTAVRELQAQVRAAEAPGTALTPVERGELVRATGPALARAQITIDWLQGVYSELEQRHDDLAHRHDALTGEIEAATQARDRVAAAFDVPDPHQLHPSYRGVPAPGTELVHSLRDAVDRLGRAQDEAALLADSQLGLRALDEMGLLPISERVGVAPAAEPSGAFPDQRIVVVGTDTSPAGYRQALQATLRPGTDLELVLRLAESDKLPLQVEFVRVEVAEQGATGQALASNTPSALEKSGAWPDPRKHARPWEKTKWTEPQPPFLFKVSMVPVFDKIMAPFHHFVPGEVPAFLFPENLPFSKTIYNVPEGVHTFQSDVGMDLFHARILSLGILDRIPNHPWVRQFVQNRPWIGKAILGVTKWLPANTAHGQSVHVPLSVDFVNKHPRVAFALGSVEQWLPSIRNGRWIQLVPMIRGTRTHAWFDDARPDPAPLHRADLAKPLFSPEAQHLDGSVTRPYTGESVDIPESLAQRWRANEHARERIQEWTQGEYDRFELDRVAGDKLVHRIADQAAAHPDRYSGGDPKRWVRGNSNEWVRDPAGSLLPRHADGSTWLRDAEGNVRPRAEIVANLQRARDYLMRNSELNRIPDVPELWNRMIDGKPLREDVIGLEAALAEANHLATHPEATGHQAHQAAKKAGYDWDANRPQLTGDRAERSLWGKLTGRRATTVGFTVELDPNAPDAARTRRFGTTAYYGRQGFEQVNGQIRDIMHGWPEAKIAEAQAEVTRLAREATRDYRGDHGLAKGGVHISARVTGDPGQQRLSVTVEHVGGGRPKDPTGYRLDQSDRELPRGNRGTAAPVGEFRGDARPADVDPLTRDELVNAIRDNLALITPEDVAWNRDGEHFVLPDGREIHLSVGETRDGAVAEFRERPDGSGYDVIASPRARSQDLARAGAHELAEIRLAEDPAVLTDPISERPTELTSHLGGRFAELKVLAAHIDSATFDPARTHDLPGLRQDMADLMAHLGLREDAVPEAIAARSPHPDPSDPWGLLAAHDPALAHRLALGFGADGLLSERPVFNRDLTAPAFEEASAAHLDRMAGALTGDFAPDVVRAESMALQGRMREELARRVFDPIFTDPGAGEARRTVRTGQLLRALDPINEAINRPGLHGVERAEAVHRAIDRFRDAMPEEFRNALGPAGFERMRRAADSLAIGADHISGVLDHGRGEMSVGTERMSLGDFLHSIDRANRGASEHGVNLEYTVVVHNPVEGRSVVEVLPRPQPQHRLPLEQNRFGEDNYRIPLQPRPTAPAAQLGGHTIDVGVGRSAFAVEMTPSADRAGGGLIIKTELAADFAVAGQRRRNLGILDPGPLTEPGTVTVFGDLLFHGDALGEGGNGAVARIFVNNVSAHFEPEVYDALAQRLPAALAPGGRIELQWDMKPEKAVDLGGRPGDRGHIRGDHLWDAIARLPEDVASRFRVVEVREFPHPGNENYDYTIDAGASNKLDANKMAQFVPPRPDHRMVIAYEPHQTAPVESEHGTAGNVGEFRGDARPEVSLTRAALLDEVGRNVQLITPEGISWNPEQEHFVVRGKEIHLDVAPLPAGVVAEFHTRPDSSYQLRVSSGALTEDAARAVGHELAEIELVERPEVLTDPVSERPTGFTSHLGGRFAELKVLAAHIDRATFDPARADELPRLRRDLADLLNHLGMSERPPAETSPGDPWTLLRGHDDVLAHRLELGLGADGLLSERPRFDRTLTEADFDAARAAHLDRLEQQLTGAHAPEVVRVEAMALDGRMREEQVRRIFDPIFADPGSAEIRRTVPTGQLFKALDPVNAQINRPGASGPAVHRAIEEFRAAMPEAFREAMGDGGFDRMHRAADGLTSGPDRITGVLDHARGAVLVGGDRLSFSEFLQGIDRANRGAVEDSLNLEYTVVVHDPVDGHSAVEVLPRPRPHHRLPLSELVFGADNHTITVQPRPSLPAAVAGAHTIDVGVGRSAFGVEMTPVADRSGGGLVIKTELADDFVIKGQRRRDLGILDPGPLATPGTVMVFGDMLFHGDALGVGETGAVARIYINNVSAKLQPDDYRALAARLPAVLAPGGRIEVQWDMKPEADGGEPGNRNHILGSDLWTAIKDLPGGQGAHFTVVEKKEWPHPGNDDYYYSIDAGSKNHVDRHSLAKFNPPQPDHRMVIVYDPAGRGYGRADPSDTAGIGVEVRRR